MPVLKVCCPPAPIVGEGGSGQHAVIGNTLWNIGQVITYAYLDGESSNMARVVDETIKTWEKYANITFQRIDSVQTSMVRISFLGPSTDSLNGTIALLETDKTKSTTRFSWLEDKYPPSPDDVATILHEFGHVLGLKHEHQSPIRGGYIELIEEAVYEHFLPLLGNDKSRVKSEVIDVYNESEFSNLSIFDPESIMLYSIPDTLNKQGMYIDFNLELTGCDKAFITLTYPRRDEDAVAAGGYKVIDALLIVGVRKEISSEILALLASNDLAGVRSKFAAYNKKVMGFAKTNKTLFSTGVDLTAAILNPVGDSVAEVIQNPLFKSILKNIVNGVFQERAIPTINSVPGSAQNDVRDTIGTVAMNPTFAQSVADLNTFFSGVSPTTTPVPVNPT